MPGRARLSGRRLRHVTEVHRAAPGDELTVGLLGGAMGRGRVTRLDAEALELEVALDRQPPPEAAAHPGAGPAPAQGAQPRAGRRHQPGRGAHLPGERLEGGEELLAAARASRRTTSCSSASSAWSRRADTLLPELHLRRLLRPFAEDELPALLQGTTALLAHPGSATPCPRSVQGPLTLVIGPEGGFIHAEIDLLGRSGCRPVHLGARILRVETAVAALVGRLC